MTLTIWLLIGLIALTLVNTICIGFIYLRQGQAFLHMKINFEQISKWSMDSAYNSDAELQIIKHAVDKFSGNGETIRK